MKTSPDQARLALADATAQRILLHERIMEPPVPVKELLKQYAVVSPFEHPTEMSFCLEQDSIWYVFINSKLSKRSPSFIHAHEMGHLFMNHLHFDNTRLTTPQFQLLKHEADHFAENLLMPADWIRSACGHGKSVNEDSLVALVEMFSVSPDTMKNRLQHLGIHFNPLSHDSYKMDGNNPSHNANDDPHLPCHH